MDNPRKRKGIMGGTFDPIHFGHLLIAENAADQFALDEVIFMPTGISPHKKDIFISDAAIRCEMIQRGIQNNPRFSLSLLEVNSNEINFTYKTLEYLKEQEPETDFYFIMGGDSLFYFDTWRCPERILKVSAVLAAIREDWEGDRFDQQIAYLNETLHGRIYRLNTPNFTISSRKIRELAAQNKSIRYMVPDAVLTYIQKNNLYQG